MNTLLKTISLIGLSLTVVPACLVFTGTISWSTHAALMLVGTVLWFITAPFWMHGNPPKRWFWQRRRPV